MGALISSFSNLMGILQGVFGGAYIFVTYFLGACAMVFAITSYQLKNRLAILLNQLISHIFWTAYFIFNGAFIGAVLNLISLLRCIVFSYKDKYKWAKSYFWLAFFIVICVAISILSWAQWYDFLPILGTIGYTFSFYMTSEKRIRYICLISLPMWLLYGIFSASYMAVINDSISLVSIVVAIIRYHLPKKEKN